MSSGYSAFSAVKDKIVFHDLNKLTLMDAKATYFYRVGVVIPLVPFLCWVRVCGVLAVSYGFIVVLHINKYSCLPSVGIPHESKVNG